MARKSKLKVRRYSAKSIVLIAESGKGYIIEPIVATGQRFQCAFDDAVIEFEFGKQGYLNKTGKAWMPEELYNVLVAYAEMQIRTVFRGYKKNGEEKPPESTPQLELFEEDDTKRQNEVLQQLYGAGNG